MADTFRQLLSTIYMKPNAGRQPLLEAGVERSET